MREVPAHTPGAVVGYNAAGELCGYLPEPSLGLILRPKGRGNWSTLQVTVTGQRASPLLVRKGHTITLGGVVFRICEVRA